MNSAFTYFCIILHIFSLPVTMCHAYFVNGLLSIYKNEVDNIVDFDAENAMFGKSISFGGTPFGYLLHVNQSACQPIQIHLPNNLSYYAIYKRRDCESDDFQANNLQLANFKGAIFYEEDFQDLIRMKAKYSNEISIYVTFVTYSTAKYLINDYQYTTNYSAVISATSNFGGFRAFLITAAVLGVITLCGVICAGSIHCCYNCYKRHKARLPLKKLKTLPTKSFEKNDPYDICAICLEHYEENDLLRILPCHHAYHKDCIDPWLTNSQRVCPVCKKAVLPEEDENFESANDNEQTPLLGSVPSNSPSRWFRNLISRNDNTSILNPEITQAQIHTPSTSTYGRLADSNNDENYGSFYSANESVLANTATENIFETPKSSSTESKEFRTPCDKELQDIESWNLQSGELEVSIKSDNQTQKNFYDCEDNSSSDDLVKHVRHC